MNDVPFSVLSEPGALSFFVFQKHKVSEYSLDVVVEDHGWEGAMDWPTASKALKEVELNMETEEIFIKRDDAFIVVDFDDNDVDIKCLVLDTKENAEVAYDFLYTGPDVKKTSEVYIPAKPILNGKYQIQRKLELDDVPFGTPFDMMKLMKFPITAPVQVNFLDLVKFGPFWLGGPIPINLKLINPG
eukprot:Phypoly_transcript_14628.p1 GENE.Phypoly_transcript_14628~~Phypoly_transcript_14628.p1  ORF type:complete len:187 (+),score=30.60 Phypoly_transcript_14628:417-977(+)